MKLTKKDKRTDLEKELARLHSELLVQEPGSVDYDYVLEEMETLYKIYISSKAEKHGNRNKFIQIMAGLVNTGIVGAVGFAQLVTMLHWDEEHVINSKFMSWIHKGRV